MSKQMKALSIIPVRSKMDLDEANITPKNIGTGDTVKVTSEKEVDSVLYGRVGRGEYVVLQRRNFKNFEEVSAQNDEPEDEEPQDEEVVADSPVPMEGVPLPPEEMFEEDELE